MLALYGFQVLEKIAGEFKEKLMEKTRKLTLQKLSHFWKDTS